VAQTYKVAGQSYTQQTTRNVTDKAVSNNVVTLTTDVDHNIVVGQSVTLAETSQSTAVSNKELTTNVATLTIGAHRITAGQSVTVSISDATFDGSHIVTATTSTTITYDLIASDVASASASGTVVYLDLAFNGTFVVDSNPTTTTFTYTRVAEDIASTAASGLTATHIPWNVVTTCPAGVSMVISSLMICNQSYGPGRYQVAVSDSLDFENKNIIFYNDALDTSDTVTITGGIVLDPTNKYLLVAADIEGISCSAFAVEVS
jgi:hypothetical protein